jgi:hypothetical protein
MNNIQLIGLIYSIPFILYSICLITENFLLNDKTKTYSKPTKEITNCLLCPIFNYLFIIFLVSSIIEDYNEY